MFITPGTGKKNILKRWKVNKLYTNQNKRYIVRTLCALFCQSLSNSLFDNCHHTVSVFFKLHLS